MVFDSNIEPRCAYCSHGADMGLDEIACVKHGIMSSYGFCKQFMYEPTKRVPEVRRNLPPAEFSEDDFTL